MMRPGSDISLMVGFHEIALWLAESPELKPT